MPCTSTGNNCYSGKRADHFLFYTNLGKVNVSLAAVGGAPFSSDEEWEYWSSTEYNVCNSWYMDSFGKFHFKDESYNGNKDTRRRVRAVKNF
jgi:hypothetical protein